MKLIGYFGRYYGGVLVLMQLGLVIVVLATTFVENAAHLTRSEDTGGTALGLAVYGAVEFGHQVFPIATFLAVLVAGTQLARSGELLAVEAAGVSNGRVGLAFGLVALAAVVVGLVAGDLLVPQTSARLDRYRRGGPGPSAQSLGRFYDRHTQWFRQGDTLLYLPELDSATRTFSGVAVYRLHAGLVSSVVQASRLVYEDGAWWLLDAREQTVEGAELRHHDRLPLGIDVSPQDLIDVAGDPRILSSPEILELAQRRERAGFDAVSYRLELHSRLAFPLSALFMFLVGLPWALNPSRRRSLAVNLGAGVVAIGVLLALTQVFRLLALSHELPPALGAWGVNLVCVVLVPASVALYQRHRTRGTIW